MARIVTDIEKALDVREEGDTELLVDTDSALPGGLWDPDDEVVAGGVNYEPDEEVSDGRNDA